MGCRRGHRARPRVRVSPTAGADDRAQRAALMRPSRHRSAQSVLGSLEPATLWRDTVTDGVFGRAAAAGEGEIPTRPELTARGICPPPPPPSPAPVRAQRQDRLTGGRPVIAGTATYPRLAPGRATSLSCSDAQ